VIAWFLPQRATLVPRRRAGTLGSPSCPFVSRAKARALSIMLSENTNRVEYDLPTAVTFLLAGLAVGWIVALLCSPLTENSKPRRASTAQSRYAADKVAAE